MKTVFVDSNLFLQCKDIKNLEWISLFPNPAIKILIPRAVQTEIDGFKGQGSTRRSKRAKAASTYFKEIIKHNGTFLITNNVTIGFPLRKELASIEKEPTLNSDKNDDSIIQDIISYKKIYPVEEVVLLTNDSGLMVTAREYEIEFIDIPENWLLEPEPDEKDKKINDLERRIKAFEINCPEINIQTFSNDKVVSKLEFEVLEFNELTESELDDLVDKVKQRYPLKSEFQNKTQNSIFETGLAFRKYVPPTEEDIQKYTDTLYPEWLDKVRENLRTIETYIYFKKNVSTLTLILNNTGTVPAENVCFEIKNSGGLAFYLQSEDDAFTKGWTLPPPPEAPNGKYTNNYRDLIGMAGNYTVPRLDFNLPTLPLARDKNSFYWKSKPDMLSKEWVRECEEFRHQMKSERITLSLIPTLKNKTTGGEITCSLSARNLPNPKSHSIVFTLNYKTGDIYAETLKFISL